MLVEGNLAVMKSLDPTIKLLRVPTIDLAVHLVCELGILLPWNFLKLIKFYGVWTISGYCCILNEASSTSIFYGETAPVRGLNILSSLND